MPKPDWVRAKTGFSVAATKKHSRGVVVKGGEKLRAENPIVKQHPHLFEPLVDEVAARIERATQGPGEGRAVTSKAAREALAKARQVKEEGE